MNRNFWLSLFLIIAASLSTLFMLRSTQHESPPPTQQLNQRPDAFMVNVDYSEYDDQGNLHSHLLTPKVIHYPNQNSAVFAQPNFMIYTSERVPWYITAEHGTSRDGINSVFLRDDVHIHQPAEPDNPETTILTTTATIHPPQSTATTDDPVTIVRPGSLVKGTGMEANLKTGVIKLFSHSQGFYDGEETAEEVPKKETKNTSSTRKSYIWYHKRKPKN